MTSSMFRVSHDKVFSSIKLSIVSNCIENSVNFKKCLLLIGSVNFLTGKDKLPNWLGQFNEIVPGWLEV